MSHVLKRAAAVAAAVLVVALTGCECTSCGKGWWGSQAAAGQPPMAGNGLQPPGGGIQQTGGVGPQGGVVPAGGMVAPGQGVQPAGGQASAPVWGDGDAAVRVSKPATCNTANCTDCRFK